MSAKAKNTAVVVGAGVAGLCVAHDLAQARFQVTLVDATSVTPASSAAAGLLQLAGGRISRSHLDLRRRALEGYPKLASSLGLERFRDAGHLRLTLETARTLGLAQFASTLRGLEVEARYLDATELHLFEPALVSGAAKGAVLLGDASVDPLELMAALERRLEGFDVRRVSGAVEGVALGPEVRLGGGASLRCDLAVLACGAALPSLWSDAPIEWRREPGWSDRHVGRSELRHSLELPRAGQSLVPHGGESWTLGRSGNDVSLLGLFAASSESTETRTGVRLSVPDGLPLAGVTNKDSVYVLGGLGRNGLLTAPALAAGLVETILSGRAPEWMEPFSPLRGDLDRRRSWSR